MGDQIAILLIWTVCMGGQTVIGNTNTNGAETSNSERLGTLSPGISGLIGKTMNFSYLTSYADGVQLTLAKKAIDFSAFTVDSSNAILLDSMLRGRNITELLYVASKLAGIEAKTAALANKPITTLALEDIFDPTDDIVLKAEYVDELEREITENPSILDLTQTSQSSSHGRTKRKATSYTEFWWPSTVPYKITSDFDNDNEYTQVIRDGIRHWEEETCLVFKELGKNENYPNSHILFKNGNGCYAEYVGKGLSGGQVISIGRNGYCGTIGIVAHEIGHALGFYHEQSRPDRDLYVKILYENIRPARMHNFFKTDWHETLTAGIPYDYSSIMHYYLNFFSSNGKDTLAVLEDGMDKVVGNQDRLSFYDVKLANYVYCSDRCSEGITWSACQNDGYRDPKDCSRCKCPDGWTGPYCADIKPAVNAECGSPELTASSSWQTLKSPNYDTSGLPRYSECTWRIKASQTNQRVIVRFVGTFAIPSCWGPCQDYIEVRHKDMARTGLRYCCYTTPSKEIVSHGNQALLLMRSTSGNTNKGFQLEYRVETCGCSSDESVSSAPACLETRSYQCNNTYLDCSSRPCITKYRNNTCYREVKTCCNGFKLQENTCYRAASSSWSMWSSWTSCSATCGSGSQSRNRKCLSPPCSGSPSETQICNTKPCSGWSSWLAWSGCSKTCGSGVQYRVRICQESFCSGSITESNTCNSNACPGQLSSWSGWSACSKTCGFGSQTRSRTCLNQPCSGSVTARRYCYTTCSGQWSNWGVWSGCSKTCGSGSRARSRTCLNPPCSGSATTSQVCNSNSCPGQWSNWNAWSSCSKTCGSGTRTRSRTCTTSNCSGSSAESQTCDSQECVRTDVWSNWTPWTSCSKTCGIGFQMRIRECLGYPCNGNAFQGLNCNNISCIDSWSNWSEWSSCSKSCGVGNRTRGRTCLGNNCSGSTADTQFCNTNICQV